MKRMFLILTVMLCATVCVIAQEVHGVETRMVCTSDCNPNGSWDGWGKYTYSSYEHMPWFSYEFTNMNSIPVSVEVELYNKKIYNNKTEYILIATKSFVLESRESYIFKTHEEGIDWYERHDEYYVKYKAYKLL